MKKKNIMINPNKISKEEKDFLQQPSNIEIENNEIAEDKVKYKNISITLPEEFLKKIDLYLRLNSVEGKRSGFIVRALAYYLKNQNNM